VTDDHSHDHTPSPSANGPSGPVNGTEFAVAGVQRDEYTDGRSRWDWKSKYPSEARTLLNSEAWILCCALVLFLLISGLFLGLGTQSFDIPLHGSAASPDASPTSQALTLHVDCRLLMIFFVGCVGGTTFSIKWLVHSAAKGKWHLDRRYWRLFVSLLGGVYACVILSLFEAGFIGASQPTDKPRPLALVAALAFLVGYFSDGVSGLLSNIANAVFGTLEKK
jgi:hypothetical protein